MYLKFTFSDCKVQTKSVTCSRILIRIETRGMEITRDLSVAFTGHRRYAGQCEGALRAAVGQLYDRGFRCFWSGMAVGFDLAAAEAVLALRRERPEIRLHCAVPFPGQADRFPSEEKQRYAKILRQADDVAIVSERYDPRCYLRRDEWMVDRSSVVVAWFDGSKGGTRYTWEYARRCQAERMNLWSDGQGELF